MAILINIVATINLADDVVYPKVKGVQSGYSPHHKFAAMDYLGGGVHRYQDDCLHYPGEALEVKIGLCKLGVFQRHNKGWGCLRSA